MGALAQLYPGVKCSSIPRGHLPAGKWTLTIPGMEKYEHRRLRLQELITMKFDGKHTAFANKIDREQSYVSRLLYPEGKAGKKRIAETMQEHIESACGLAAGWLDLPLGTPVNTTSARHSAAEPVKLYSVHDGAEWPFATVSELQYSRLSDYDKSLVEGLVHLMLKKAPAAAKRATRKRATA
jgi:hypothetical protein